MKIKWFKLNPDAIVPTKTPEAAGFDIYTLDTNIEMKPHSQRLFSTGLAVVPEEGFWLMVFDRGSTGSKGIHVHCGVIDNDYRGEIFICLKNDNTYPIRFTNKEEPGPHIHYQHYQQNDGHGHIIDKTTEILDYVVYPTNKAIAQIIPVRQPEVESEEIGLEEWEGLKDTDRGEGKLGSSGK